ncbi:hypothetical protein PVAND_008505 [Polypedilum vanderplanki]|uniref:Uncharacterized protein n=1 Tax=Polypedilum vanderplanki TaxID=319348 RepID=A0A9J6CAF0_POLVA|nr:hypothetical protein PVAND_008505 [Polypedilum vanderplanki]
MKISLILIFALLIVSATARRHNRHRCKEQVNDNGIEEVGEAQDTTDSESEIDPVPSDAVKKDSKCKGRRRHGGTHRSKSGYRGRFQHDPEWHKQHNVTMPEENSQESGRPHHHHKHHHHRHHHHHHHHHNCTTTRTTTTTTSTTPPTSTTLLPGVTHSGSSSTWSSIDTENIDPRTDDKNDVEEINRDP